MSDSRAVVLVGAGLLVALVVTGVVRGLAGGENTPVPGARPAEAHHEVAEVAFPSSTTTTSVRQGSSTTAAEVPVTSPAGPALAGAAAEEAVAVAERVLRADLVGEGREDFGDDYWGEGRYRPCCTEVVVHSGVARPTGRPEMVVVSLVYSARRVDAGVPLEQARSDVYLVQRDGRWLPVQPAEGGG